MLNTFYSCPADCASQTFPALPVDPNCLPTPEEGQIHGIVFRMKDATGALAPVPFTGWGTTATGTITAAAGTIDNTNTDGTKCKHIKVMGSISDPELQEAEVPGFGTRVVKQTYTLNARINGLSDEVYEFLLSLQCGRTDLFTFWYYDTAYTYGLEDGIVSKSLSVRFNRPEGEGNYAEATISLVFESKTDPQRRNNVL